MLDLQFYGHPTNEFQLLRGLRYRDPIFPFHFIIVIEGLHVIMEDVVAYVVFHGASHGFDEVLTSHLFLCK